MKMFKSKKLLLKHPHHRILFNPNTLDWNDADAIEDIPDGESVWEDDSASPPKSLFVIPNSHRLMGGVHIVANQPFSECLVETMIAIENHLVFYELLHQIDIWLVL